jgi:phosphonate transport system permease protein
LNENLKGSNEMNSAISVRNLKMQYASRNSGQKTLVTAVSDVSFDLARGETLAIIGRSGSGKTSILRAISGILPPSAGEIKIGKYLLTSKQSPHQSFYREVGLMFQDYGLIPRLSALENVLCGRLLRYSGFLGSLMAWKKNDRDSAIEYLGELGLSKRVHVRADRLSGGEQQRVGIARLLAQDPSIVLLDEPISSLDVHWANTAICRLKCEHPLSTGCDFGEKNTPPSQKKADSAAKTIIMVLHDLSMVRKFADRVLLLQDGKLIFDGDPDEGCRRLELMDAKCASSLPLQEPALSEENFPISQPLSHKPLANQTIASEMANDETRIPSKNEPQGLNKGASYHQLNSISFAPPSVFLPNSRSAFYALGLVGVIALYTWAATGVEFSFTKIFSNLGNAADFVSRMLPPNPDVIQTVGVSLVETVQMALIGTSLAAIISLPLAMLAARNISSKPFQVASRFILNFLRTVPSIIWGLFFVAMVGLGPFPGILALMFYASGYLGKFYYEGIESIDEKPLIALKTVGANRLQRFRFGIFPQVLPLLSGYTLYMFEYNVRAASILGVVGAGGIGFYLYTYINNFQYDRAATALLCLLLVVTVIDALSSRLRAWLSESA